MANEYVKGIMTADGVKQIDYNALANIPAAPDPAGTAESKVAAHNTDSESHNDLRLLVEEIKQQVTSFFDIDEETLNQLSELIASIVANRNDIAALTTSKVNVTDIINNLVTNATNKPLSAAQGVALKGLIDKLSKGNADYIIEDYVKTEAKEVVDKIVAKRTINSLVLLISSDIHVSAGETVRTAIKHMGQGMKEICNYITPDGAVFLGDYIYNTTPSSKDHGIDDMKYMELCVSEIKKTLLSIFLDGNHDYYSTSTSDTDNRLSEDEVYALIGSHNSDKVVVDVDNLGRNYGYVDFSKQRIRLIYLNTTDIADVDYTSHLISTAQGKWFVNTALDLSDKSDEEKWGVIVCSHIPLFDNPQVPIILGNFVDRSNGSNFETSYSFADTKAELIAVFHGHLHNFKVTVKTTKGGNTITYICIPNAVPNRENPYTTEDHYEVDESGEGVFYPKTSGTANDTAFNAVIIDRDNEKIHAICYGAGYDREISYSQEPEEEAQIINQIPISTDTTGAIYNEVGYKDGVRIGSDGTDRTGASTDATGYIPATTADTLYFANCQIVVSNGTSTANQGIVCYDSSKKYLGVRYVDIASQMTMADYDVDSNSNLTRYNLFDLNANTAFVRITGNYIGVDSIITVNQPIN